MGCSIFTGVGIVLLEEGKRKLGEDGLCAVPGLWVVVVVVVMMGGWRWVTLLSEYPCRRGVGGIGTNGF